MFFLFLEFQLLRKINMCMMLYVLQTHEQLETVLSYVPANVPISGDDIIPGVDESNYSEQGNVLFFYLEYNIIFLKSTTFIMLWFIEKKP